MTSIQTTSLNLYGDERDFLFRIPKARENLEERYSSKRETNDVYLYNSLGMTVKYVKISQEIFGKEVRIYEAYDVPNYFTLYLKIRAKGLGDQHSERMYINVSFMIDEEHYYSFDVSEGYNYVHDRNVKMHFKFDANTGISLFEEKSTKSIYIVVIIFLLFVIWIFSQGC